MSELIDPYLSHLRAGGRSPNTIASRAVILRRFDRLLPRGLDDAATHELEHLLGRHQNAWTVKTYYEALVDFYQYAIIPSHDVYLSWDPTTELIRPRTPECLPNPVTDRELQLALANSSPWWRTPILFAAKAGLRVSEIAGLRWSKVTPDWIFVRGKGGNPESVPTNAELWALRSADTGPILEIELTGAQLSHRARRHFDRIGLPKVHLHRFRHWYATELLRAGVDVRTVQELMRHRNLASTQGYTLITSGQRRAAVNALPVLTGAALPD